MDCRVGLRPPRNDERGAGSVYGVWGERALWLWDKY